MLKDLGLTDKRVLLVLPEKDEKVMLSARNIPAVDVIRVADLNAYHAAAYDRLVFTVDALASFRHADEGATS
jgi:large subunit ribosomal protein L4